jgi:hypothetical protein
MLYYIPQYKTTTLSVPGGIDASQTTGIILADIDGIDDTVPGILCVNWDDPVSISTAEYITYTSINSGTFELNGVTRGAEGIAAKAHANGVTVGFTFSKSHINEINDTILVQHDSDGTHDDITATTIKGKTTKFPTVSGEYDNGNSGTSKEIDWANGDRQKVTITGDACAFTFANATAGQTLTLRVVVDATGHTAWTWPTLMWPSGSAGTPGITANKINLYIFYFDGTNYLAQLAAEFSTPA